jgi:hypothetical protein
VSRPVVQVQATAIEPVIVIPEVDLVEMSPAPALLPIQIRETAERLVPRPEHGIEPMPYMPYADEEAELARRRRDEVRRLAEEQTEEPPLIRQVRELQETAEPPLRSGIRNEPRRTGKLPCSMK